MRNTECGNGIRKRNAEMECGIQTGKSLNTGESAGNPLSVRANDQPHDQRITSANDNSCSLNSSSYLR